MPLLHNSDGVPKQQLAALHTLSPRCDMPYNDELQNLSGADLSQSWREGFRIFFDRNLVAVTGASFQPVLALGAVCVGQLAL